MSDDSHIDWNSELEPELQRAAKEGRYVLLDFSAVPMGSGCARLDAEVYPDERVTRMLQENFVPVRVHVREQRDEFQRLGARYGAHWTPAF